MPKKPNRTDMQEYVPAGNGDASGEYADESGSNTHFTNFVNPQGTPKAEPTEEPKVEEKPKDPEELEIEKARKSFNDFLDTKYCAEKIKPYAKKYFENCPKETKDILNNLTIQKGVAITNTDGGSYCGGLGADVNFNVRDLTSIYRTDGEVFFHELGHGVDESYRKDFDESVSKKHTNLYDAMSSSASDTFVTSNGKTLNDTLLRMKPPARERFSKAKADFNKAKEDFYKQNFPDIVGGEFKLREMHEKIYAERQKYREDPEYIKDEEMLKNYRKKVSDGEMSWREYNNIFDPIHSKRIELINEYDRRAEKSEYAEKLRELSDKIFKGEQEFKKQIGKHWADVSDMFSMQGAGNLGFCHSSTYAKQKGFRGKEFFAECFSAESCDPKATALIQKYFPEAWKAYKETKQEIMRIQKEGIKK